MASLAIAACSSPPPESSKNPTIQWNQPGSPADTLLKNMLQKNGEQIALLVEEKLEADTSFHSLEAIKDFIHQELKKRGLSAVSITAQLVPFALAEDGQHIYMSLDIRVGKQEGFSFSIHTDNPNAKIPTLERIMSNFEKQIGTKALEAFVSGVANNDGHIEVTSLEDKITTMLGNKKGLFLEHRLEFRGVKIGQDNETGEVMIYIEVYDSVNNEIMHIPVPTGILEEKPKTKKFKGETMLAFVS